MSKVKVEWIGRPGFEEYHGSAGGEEELHLLRGQSQQCTAEQAAYLDDTFPGLVSVGGKVSEAPAGPKPIEEWTKAELKAEYGDVEGFPKSGNQAAMVEFVNGHLAVNAASSDPPSDPADTAGAQ